MKNLVLASNSPRRKELLALLGLPFTVVSADINEDRRSGETPSDYVYRLAEEKARAVSARQAGLIVAADTIVADGDMLLGKPIDAADARRMLLKLRGRTHQVFTGLAIIDTATGEVFRDVVRTDVTMRHYSDADMNAYIASGDPLDKAGAYAIQHADFHPVQHIDGCYASVMGLPLCRLALGLSEFGIAFPPYLPDQCQTMLHCDCPDWQKLSKTQ